MNRDRLRDVGVALALLSLVSVFLGLDIYRDGALLVGDSLYYEDPTFRTVGQRTFTTRPSNPVMDLDNDLYNYPFRHFARASFGRGEIPWWNPYVAMGVPFAGLGTGLFDPVAALAGALLPAATFSNAIAVLGLLIGALGMYAFLGSLGLPFWARVFGSVAFPFSAWSIAFLGRQNFMAEAWMPWLFWAAERRIRARSGPHVALLALFAGLITLAGHLQTAFHALAALALYSVARLAREPRAAGERVRAGAALGAAVALGIGVGLVQIVPMLDLLAQPDLPPVGRSLQGRAGDAWTAVGRGVRGDPEVMGAMLPTAVTAVSPWFFGAPHNRNYWWVPGFAHFSGAALYVGLLPLFFAACAFARLRRSPEIRIWALLAAGSLGAALAVPVFNLVNHLPVFDLVNNGRLRGVYRFAICVAAAYGLARLFEIGKARSPRTRIPLAGLGYAAAVLAVPLLVFRLLPLHPYGAEMFARHGAEPLWRIARMGVGPALGILAVSGAALFCWSRRWIPTSAFAAAACLIAYADSYHFLHGFNPAIPSEFVFPSTPVVEFLKRDPSYFRVSSSFGSGAMRPNTKLPYEIFDVDIYSVLVLGRYASVQSLVRASSAEALRTFRFGDPLRQRGLIDLMNLKYLIVPRAPDPSSDPFAALPGYRLAYDREVRIYENLHALPRAFLAGRSRIAETSAHVLDELRQPGFDPRRAVLLEDPDAPALAEIRGDAPAGRAEIVSLGANQVVVRTTALHPSYLVLSEMNHPGWRAWLDGQEAPIYSAYYLFRAVHVGAGRHEVVFRFMPPAYSAALATSGVCLAAILVLLAGGLRNRRPR